jgi:hypothetical protein
MQIITDIAVLQPGTAYWVPAIEAPVRDWPGAPGCRRGARFLIDATRLRPSLSGFPAFESRSECLRWIMTHQRAIADTAPAAHVHAAQLDAWMLGIDAI